MRIALVVLVTACQVGVTEPPPPSPTAPTAPAASPPTVPITPLAPVVAEPPRTGEVAPPWTLTASDGSGLQLTRIDAKAVVQGPLAFTELHLDFHNPEDRTREGTFAITLPSGATVSRFAMELDGRFQEAEVVDKALARRVYDDYLHRRQDPALLEKAVGNQFSAKVFPIPAKADKHLVIAFSQELIGRGYALPLRGLPKTERVDVRLSATGLDGTPHEQVLSERNWQPDRDFLAAIPSSAAAVMAGELVVGALPFSPQAATASASLEEVTLLVDTSASRALGYAAYVRSIHELVGALGARTVQVVAFDQDRETIFDGPVTDYDDRGLLARGAAGASNLAQALAGLAPHRRVVVVTDGVMTAGPATPEVAAAIAKLPVDRVDVVLAGGIRDERFAAAIARAGLPHAGDVLDLDRGVAGVAIGLAQPVSVDIAIEIPGATWSYPRRVPAARPGSALMVYARMARSSRVIDIAIGGVHRTIGVGLATPVLIERAIAGAEIEELENQLAAPVVGADEKALREDIAARSIKARVISSQTAMLVLESDADYTRYKIERSALADILVVGPHGIEQTHREPMVAMAPKPPTTAAIETERQQLAQELTRLQTARSQLAVGSGHAFASPRGTGDISSGFDDTNIARGLLGNEAGEGAGGDGFDAAQAGPGGGGTGFGTIGTGRYGTIGRGVGTGNGYGVGGGRGGLRGRTGAVPVATLGAPTVAGELDRAIIRRYLKRNLDKIQYCYEKELLARPRLAGEVALRFTINSNGSVASATGTGVDAVGECVASVVRTIEFPRPRDRGIVQVAYPIAFAPAPVAIASFDDDNTEDPREARIAPLTGKLAEVMAALAAHRVDQAFALATAWHDGAPGDVLALIALGECDEAAHHLERAARTYGSIIDLYATRADLRRFAGERLERLGEAGRALAIDTYRKAVADRPDHLTGHRLLAYALVRGGDLEGAFAAILAGIDQSYPEGRFLGGARVLAEDAGMIAATYLAHDGPRDRIEKELAKRSLTVATTPSTRFILYWETDGNDVDFHIRDAHRGHAWYAHKHLRSGGDLYADVTTGYGPECFAIAGTPQGGPYRLSINYYSQGPMGYGMGLLQIQQFDGKELRFGDRPYVIMVDHAFVDLGTF